MKTTHPITPHEARLLSYKSALSQVASIQKQLNALADELRASVSLASKANEEAGGRLVSVSFDSAIRAVELVTDLPREKIMSRSKLENVKMARFWMYWILSEGRSPAAVALVMGRDRGAVVNGLKKLNGFLSVNDRICVETKTRIMAELAKTT